MQLLPKKSRDGFTLIEILIALAVMGILFLLLIINFRQNQNSKDIRNDALLVLDGVKRVQTMSLSGQINNDQSPTSYEFLLTTCSLDSGCPYSLNAKIDDTVINTIETVTIKNSKLSVVDNSGGAAGSQLLIGFKTPRAMAEIKVDGSSTNDAIIKLEHIKDSGIVRFIKINSISGRMDIVSGL